MVDVAASTADELAGSGGSPENAGRLTKPAGLMLLVRDAAGQSGLTQSPPQTHKRTHPSPEQAVAQSKPGDG